MKPHAMFRVACAGLAVALVACTSSGSHRSPWLRAHGLIPAGVRRGE